MVRHKILQNMSGRFVRWLNNDEFVVSINGKYLIGHKDFWEGDFDPDEKENTTCSSTTTTGRYIEF